jgi:hypothetical protein
VLTYIRFFFRVDNYIPIALFLMATIASVLQDFSRGSPGMDPVMNIIEQGGIFIRSLPNLVAGMRDKPIIRCQNCTKSPKEIGGGVKFMVCGACRSNLKFSVHYCSK